MESALSRGAHALADLTNDKLSATIVTEMPRVVTIGQCTLAKPGEPAAMASSAQRLDGMAPAATPTHHLPKTGSQWPLVGLIGLLSLAGAVSLRQLRARQQ